MAAGEAFGRDQHERLAEAVAAAQQQTGMHFPVYVGSVQGDIRHFAETELAGLRDLGDELVLVVVAPGERQVQIVTTPGARRRLSDQACGLAALSMTTSFGLGDLVGGITVGLRMLADATGPERATHGRPSSTSSTVTP